MRNRDEPGDGQSPNAGGHEWGEPLFSVPIYVCAKLAYLHACRRHDARSRTPVAIYQVQGDSASSLISVQFPSIIRVSPGPAQSVIIPHSLIPYIESTIKRESRSSFLYRRAIQWTPPPKHICQGRGHNKHTQTRSYGTERFAPRFHRHAPTRVHTHTHTHTCSHTHTHTHTPRAPE